MNSRSKYRLTGIIIYFVSWNIVGCSKVVSPPNIPYSSPSPTLPASPASPTAKINAAKLRQLGLQYRQQGRYTEAITSLEKATSLEPQNLSGQVLLGWTLHLAGRETPAITVLQNVLEKDANYIPALNALGIVYLVSGNLSAAVTTHERARKLKSDNEIAYYNLTLAYHRLRQYDLAIARGKQATVLEPSNPHPWVALALVYWEKGMKKQAQQTYYRAVQLDSRYRQSAFLSHLKQAGFSLEQIETTRKILDNI